MPSSFARRALATSRRAVIAAALVTALACDNLDNIDVDAGGKVEVPAATLVDTLLSPALSFAGFDSIDFSQDFANQGVTKDQIDSVKLKSFTLTVDAPSNGNFDFIDSLSFTASASGQPSIEIARLDVVPKGARTLTLSVSEDVELSPYVVAPSMRISGTVKGKRPDVATTVSAAVVLDVDIHVPGCN
jgi:hypothetical protein